MFMIIRISPRIHICTSGEGVKHFLDEETLKVIQNLPHTDSDLNFYSLSKNRADGKPYMEHGPMRAFGVRSRSLKKACSCIAHTLAEVNKERGLACILGPIGWSTQDVDGSYHVIANVGINNKKGDEWGFNAIHKYEIPYYATSPSGGTKSIDIDLPDRSYAFYVHPAVLAMNTHR